MERDSLSTYPHFLFISSHSINFLYQNCVMLSLNVKNSTPVADVTKNLTYRHKKIILSQIHCEKAPQVVKACAPHMLDTHHMMDTRIMMKSIHHMMDRRILSRDLSELNFSYYQSDINQIWILNRK